MFQQRSNQTPAFAPDALGAAPAPAPTTPEQAGQLTTSSMDAVKGQYREIFQEQMAEQAALFKDITKLNDQKNEQSSYLSLAKGVSEMV